MNLFGGEKEQKRLLHRIMRFQSTLQHLMSVLLWDQTVTNIPLLQINLPNLKLYYSLI